MTTPRRTIRVPDEVWLAAAARAASEGRTVSDVVVKGLERYAHPKPPDTTSYVRAPSADPAPEVDAALLRAQKANDAAEQAGQDADVALRLAVSAQQPSKRHLHKPGKEIIKEWSAKGQRWVVRSCVTCGEVLAPRAT